MTAVVGVFIHPNGCPVCTDGQVQVRREPWSPPVGPVIPCPQCRGADSLDALVAKWHTSAPRGGDAA